MTGGSEDRRRPVGAFVDSCQLAVCFSLEQRAKCCMLLLVRVCQPRW
jgi:hypothetical protein